MNVLIVEDDFTTREYMKNLVKPHAKVLLAKDGMDALNIYEKSIREEKIDLIYLDIIIPRVDGYKITKIIRAFEKKKKLPKKKRVKIVIVSSIDDFNTKRLVDENLVDAYVKKPIKDSEILDHIK